MSICGVGEGVGGLIVMQLQLCFNNKLRHFHHISYFEEFRELDRHMSMYPAPIGAQKASQGLITCLIN
jgi:hypothetical protein